MSDDMKCSGVRDCCSPHIHRNIHYEDQFIYKNQTRRVQSVETWNFGENGPGVPVDRLNMWCAFSVKVPAYILGCSSKGIESRLREVIIPLYLAIVKLHLEYCVQLWAPQYKRDLLESVQWKATKTNEGTGTPVMQGKITIAALHTLQKASGKPFCIEWIQQLLLDQHPKVVHWCESTRQELKACRLHKGDSIPNAYLEWPLPLAGLPELPGSCLGQYW